MTWTDIIEYQWEGFKPEVEDGVGQADVGVDERFGRWLEWPLQELLARLHLCPLSLALTPRVRISRELAKTLRTAAADNITQGLRG